MNFWEIATLIILAASVFVCGVALWDAEKKRVSHNQMRRRLAEEAVKYLNSKTIK